MTDTKKAQIFTCKDIDWAEIEEIFAAIEAKKLGKERESTFSPESAVLDLVIISDHVRTCQDCADRLLELAQKHGIKARE